MSNAYYVTASATGSGTGTQASPWTLGQATSGAASGSAGSQSVVNVQSGNYATATANLYVFAQNNLLIRAYATTPGDGGTANLSTSVSSNYTVRLTGTGTVLEGFAVDSTNATYGAMDTGSLCVLYRCALAGPNGGYVTGAGAVALLCQFGGAGTYTLRSGATAIGCAVVSGASLSGGTCVFCTSEGSPNASFLGPCTLVNCVGDGAAYHGVQSGAVAVSTIISNAGYGAWGNSSALVNAFGCATYNNAASGDNAPNYAPGLVAPTASPYVNRSGGNFALNTMADGGALLRGAGIPGVFPGGTTTGYPDIGAVQSKGGGNVIVVED